MFVYLLKTLNIYMGLVL